jgi:hypothetical protein
LPGRCSTTNGPRAWFIEFRVLTTRKGGFLPHHQPFQYYASTANLTHARPSSLAAIGKSVGSDGATPEPANHQYDSHDFFEALAAGNLPAVVLLKAPAFQDGHAGYSKTPGAADEFWTSPAVPDCGHHCHRIPHNSQRRNS